ncbi:MAG: cadherin-like domain-containing protein, partial [Verrucomicrobiae bacterium]|nr:cadherin-like domain-containing protein [Verrucomicrobiae bacterium]
RASCYRCHPGQETRCLRGAMGSAVVADGTMAMQCQSCHGSMLDVGAAGRTGWLEQPNCQACHTGTAIQNNGQIRYQTAHETDGTLRQAVNQTFATQPNTPANCFSLYRFSAGHGGLQCEACHGSTHAEYPSTHANDNVQSEQLQGHAGMISDCTACHATSPSTTTGGPHGMHPVGQDWVRRHDDAAEDNAAQCRTCHGLDYRGTVLSRSLGDRTLSAFGTRTFWRGFQIGCYTCHAGPSNEHATSNRAPVVANRTASGVAGQPVGVTLSATDADGNPLTLRIVQQPAHGTVALAGTQATYHPDATYVGSDSFTYAAWDGSTDSNLGRVDLTVGNGTCAFDLTARVPSSASTGAGVPFRAAIALSDCADSAVYQWSFDDGTTLPDAGVCHAFTTPGDHVWQLMVTAGGVEKTLEGVVSVAPGADTVLLQVHRATDGSVVFSWPTLPAGYVMEHATRTGSG